MTATNRLDRETSPYLRQHAHNPVDWYSWGEEALERAKAQNKPILLSIGYSACHWCHVMAHESFEDPVTAAVMNEQFINIKVDREERPDLDKIYQLAHQLLTRRPGGWPLTVFLDPHNQLPFFAGTYFPSAPRFNLPGFVQVLQKVGDYYHHRRGDLETSQQAIRNVLAEIGASRPVAETVDESLLRQAVDSLAGDFDPVHGGFGQAPKFPHTRDLMFLFRSRTQSEHAADRNRKMVETSLTRMAQGGIYDHLGGGFFRYSVDGRWEIPHFEKMLYDNGPLLSLYAAAWQRTGDPLYRAVAEETADWVLRDMQAPLGAFFSSLDADSEGVEGKYYVWERDDIRALLTPEQYAAFEIVFGLNETPNFEGQWHLRRTTPADEASARLGVGPEQVLDRVAQARATLRAHREQRVRPGCDDKVLVSWNALVISGLAAAGRVFGREDWIRAAYRCFDFLRGHCWRDGRLQAVWKDGGVALRAYLDDYVMLIDACIELLQAEWRTDALIWAMELADGALRYFEDADNGGFFFTAEDHEALIFRPKPLMDESLPSGNGIAALALLRLGQLIGEPRYSAAAERTLKAALPSIQQHAAAHGALLDALQEWLDPPALIVLRGTPDALQQWRRALGKAASALLFAIPSDAENLPGDLAERQPSEQVVAYVCRSGVCLPAIQNLDELRQALREL